jgi:hypothetical protein
VQFTLNYDRTIPLDAEALAETGIREAYESLLPELQKFVSQPLPVEEMIDNHTPSYVVLCGGQRYTVVDSEREREGRNSWGQATWALFDIVNNQLQLSGLEYRFYAINGGNDLFGIFLTPENAQSVQIALAKREWPYIPAAEPPWFGQFH